MKQIINAFIQMTLDSLYGFHYLINKPKTETSLLAYNVNWFTNCSWLEQLYCFKQLDGYITYKL
jgi:hypothetical protein